MCLVWRDIVDIQLTDSNSILMKCQFDEKWNWFLWQLSAGCWDAGSCHCIYLSLSNGVSSWKTHSRSFWSSRCTCVCLQGQGGCRIYPIEFQPSAPVMASSLVRNGRSLPPTPGVIIITTANHFDIHVLSHLVAEIRFCCLFLPLTFDLIRPGLKAH